MTFFKRYGIRKTAICQHCEKRIGWIHRSGAKYWCHIDIQEKKMLYSNCGKEYNWDKPCPNGMLGLNALAPCDFF